MSGWLPPLMTTLTNVWVPMNVGCICHVIIKSPKLETVPTTEARVRSHCWGHWSIPVQVNEPLPHHKFWGSSGSTRDSGCKHMWFCPAHCSPHAARAASALWHISLSYWDWLSGLNYQCQQPHRKLNEETDVDFSGINGLVFFIKFHSLKYSVGFFNEDLLLRNKNC